MSRNRLGPLNTPFLAATDGRNSFELNPALLLSGASQWNHVNMHTMNPANNFRNRPRITAATFDGTHYTVQLEGPHAVGTLTFPASAIEAFRDLAQSALADFELDALDGAILLRSGLAFVTPNGILTQTLGVGVIPDSQ